MIVTNVLVIGVLATGSSRRDPRVQEREQNILRRFKVARSLRSRFSRIADDRAPVVHSGVILTFSSRVPVRHGAADRPISLLFFVAIGALAFRASA